MQLRARKRKVAARDAPSDCPSSSESESDWNPTVVPTTSPPRVIESSSDESAASEDEVVPEEELEVPSPRVRPTPGGRKARGARSAGGNGLRSVFRAAKANKIPEQRPTAKAPRRRQQKTPPRNPIVDSSSDEESQDDGEDDPEAAVQRLLTEEVEPPPGMLMQLLPFQRQSLAWMRKQELETSFKGGILADEMGMGKTIQALSLIMENRRRTSPSNPTPLPSRNETVKTTLVVCPVVALIQWKAEIERWTESGSLRYYIYHGPDRTRDLDELAQFDVVMTTYSVVQAEYRKRTGVFKEECQYCGKKYFPDKLIVHHKYFCGPNAKKTAKQAKQEKHVERPTKRRTIEIVPKGDALEKAEPDSRVFGTLTDKKNQKLAGVTRRSTIRKKSERDTQKTNQKGKPRRSGRVFKAEDEEGDTDYEEEDDDEDDGEENGVYGTGLTWMQYAKECAMARYSMKEEFKRRESENSEASPLHNLTFHRIVLDEAHAIKQRSCSTAKAIFALNAEYRWALSGTPLQNRVSELYSLVRFIRVDPFAYYFNKAGDCQSLDWDFNPETRKCEQCGGTRMSHYCWWNKYIMNPIKRDGYQGTGKKAMRVLKTQVLNGLLLRRTKAGCQDISLPSKTIVVRKEKLSEEEEDFYTALYEKTQAKFNTYVDQNSVMNNYGHIFSLLLRLRQAVLHPYLVTHSETAFRGRREAGVKCTVTCGLCREEAQDAIQTACDHVFCRQCITEYVCSFDVSRGATQTCPSCPQVLSVDLGMPAIEKGTVKLQGILARIGDLSNFKTSTKLDALVNEIRKMEEERPQAKAIVFSQFVNMLDIVEHKLKLEDIQCVKLDGRMSVDRREKFINDFMQNPKTKIFLMSLKAGGVALNLTAASRAFIMDPWWNPAAESQAMDRIHRMGQKQAVTVTRIVVTNSIEDRVLKLQEKKQLVFDATVGEDRKAAEQLSEEDMKFLFS